MVLKYQINETIVILLKIFNRNFFDFEAVKYKLQ